MTKYAQGRDVLMERYRDLMLEIKERTLSIGNVVNGETGLHGPLAREFCFLQLRLICECIALSCLVAHGDMTPVQMPKFQKAATKADLLMKLLEELHQDFYPHPVRFEFTANEICLNEITESSLSRSELIRLVRICGDKLHRGYVKRYTFRPTQEQLAKDFNDIMRWANQILRLLEQHKVTLVSGNEYIFCIFSYGPDARVQVFLGGPGPKSEGFPPNQ
jgi:hypothetical protein